jgi:ABC-type transport system involved in multi-copper enzyme maturation permease subunit
MTLARNTFREAIRDKIYVLVVAFGLLMVLSTIVISPLTVGAQKKIVADVGLASISIFALLVVLFLGSGMVHKEIDKRTIMAILSKPITHLDYLLGKFLGLLATLVVLMAAMTALFVLACLLTKTPFKPAFLVAILLSVCEMIVVVSVLILFSSFTTPVLTSLFTLATFLAGHTVQDLERFAIVTESHAVERVMKGVKIVLPNLDLFNVRNAAVHGLPIATEHVLWAILYALLYGGVMLAISDVLFRRREFK